MPRERGVITPKQQRFVEEYLVDMCANKAAERAGYKDRTSGNQLVRKSHIQAAIQEEKEKLSKRTHLSQDRWAKEVARLSFVDPRRLYDEDGNLKPIHELDDDIAACISSIEVVTTYKKNADGELEPEYTKKIKLWDKNSALDKGGRFLKLLSGDVPPSPPPGSTTNNIIFVMSDEERKLFADIGEQILSGLPGTGPSKTGTDSGS